MFYLHHILTALGSLSQQVPGGTGIGTRELENMLNIIFELIFQTHFCLYLKGYSKLSDKVDLPLMVLEFVAYS